MSDSRSKFYENSSPLASPMKRLEEINWDEESTHESDADSEAFILSDDEQDITDFQTTNYAAKSLKFSPEKNQVKRIRKTNDDDVSDDESSEKVEQTFRGPRQPMSPIKPNSVYSRFLVASTSLNEHSRKQITAEVLEARVIGSVQDALVTQNRTSFDKVTAFVGEFFSNEENFAATLNAYEAKKSIFGQNISPICVSFVVAQNNKTDQEFILIGISSPDRNIDLQQRLQNAAETSHVAALFKFQIVMSESASKDYQKLILAVTQHIGSPVASDPGRPCAEKAYFSSFIKLQQEQGADLTVKMICNVKFLPQQVSGENPELPTDLAFDVGAHRFKMAIIAPCPDCKKNMAANALVMAAAAAGNEVLSPIRQKGIKRVLNHDNRMYQPKVEQSEDAGLTSAASTAVFLTPPRRF